VSKAPSKKPHLTQKEANQAAKALEILFASEYISKKELYKENFFRGIFFSVGGIIGASFAITVLLWLLTILSHFELLQPFVNDVKQSVEQVQTK